MTSCKTKQKMQELEPRPTPAEERMFEPFKVTELIRIIYSRVQEFFDLEEMVSQGLLVVHFPQHNLTKATKVYDGLPSLTKGILPWHGQDDENDEKIRNYFGEEIAFFWNFLVTFTRWLVIPAILGILLIPRRKLKESHPMDDEWAFTIPWPRLLGGDFTYHLFLNGKDFMRCIQVLNGLLVLAWAAMFTQYFIRSEQEKVARWGMRATAGAVTMNPRYNSEWDQDRKGYMKVQFFRQIGSVGALGTMIFICWIIAKVMAVRKDMIEDPEDYSWVSNVLHPLNGTVSHNQTITDVTWTSITLGPLYLTIQIKILDIIWEKLARFLTEKSNYRTLEEKHDALAVKLFSVKCFNWAYPYFYIAFIKIQYEGCTNNDCVPELQSSLASFFLSSMAIDFAIMLVMWFMARQSIKSEMAKIKGIKVTEENYSYLEVQSKLAEADEPHMELVVIMSNFAFICFFTIASPFLPVFALAYNCLVAWLYWWKRLYVNRRNVPKATAGLGIWVSMMRTVVLIAGVLNCMIAIFTMDPMKDMEPTTKGILFLALEHCCFAELAIFFSVFSDRPDHANIWDEANANMIQGLLDPTSARATKIKPAKEELSPPTAEQLMNKM